MRAFTVKDGVINNIAKFKDGENLPDGWIEAKNGESIGWIDNGGGSFSAPPAIEPELSYDEKVYRYRSAVGLHIDQEAQALGYDDVSTAVTYADEPAVLKFQQEGQALRAWRSQVWTAYYSILADVERGSRSEPTVEELIAELPAFPRMSLLVG